MPKRAAVEQRNITSLELWQCAWSLVLRCYLGTDSIHYHYREYQSSAPRVETEAPDIVVDVVIAGSKTISDIVRDIGSTTTYRNHDACDGPIANKSSQRGEEVGLGNSLLLFRRNRDGNMPSKSWIPTTGGERTKMRAVSKEVDLVICPLLTYLGQI